MTRRRQWYRLAPGLLEVADTTAIAASLFGWLDATLREMTVDAYTDVPPAELPLDVVRAEAVLRALRAGAQGDHAWIGIKVKSDQPEAWAAAQVYAPWSILVELFADDGHMGSFDDCGQVVLNLTTEQAAYLADIMGDRVALTPLT